MSGSLIGGIVGAGIGLIVSGGNPMGALYGWSAGSVAGGLLFPQHVDGPRLTDLKPQSSEYGRPIPIVYGTVAISGNVIWAPDYIREKGQSGGKGGPTVDTESYYANFAIALCEGEADVLRMWAGPEKRLIWDGVTLEGNGKVRIYKGTEDQLPDPLIESYLGVGNVPAYRGTTYVVFEHFPLEKDGNTIPFITAEVTTVSDVGACGIGYKTVQLGGGSTARMYDNPPEKLGTVYAGFTAKLGSRGVATDKSGNVYLLVYGTNSDWYLKRVSSTNPIQESMLPLGVQFNGLSCLMAYDPSADQIGIIQIENRSFGVVDCDSFALGQVTQTDFYKCDIVYSTAEGGFRFMNMKPEHVNGQLDADNWGVDHIYGTGTLIECGSHGMAVALDTQLHREWTQTYLNGAVLTNICASIYDPVRDRLVALIGSSDGYSGYYDFASGETVVPADAGTQPRGNFTYSQALDRILYSSGGIGTIVMDPAKLTSSAFPDECTLLPIHTGMYYADGTFVQQNGDVQIILLPGMRDKVVVAQAGPQADIYTFSVGAAGGGVTLASVVANLSERSKQPRYDVSQLESDIVDGYTIARQTTVRNAIDALRPAYLFDAVESEGKVKFVKRGGAPVATIDVDDLDARGDGQSAGDPLLTTRQMEVELPRVVNVNYLLAATDYSPATKLAKRLVGASGSETTLDLPLVLTDTKAQEVADVNLQLSWVQRLTYSFNLPRKYSGLEPTDHIVVKGNGMRLTKATRTPQGVIKCEAVADGSTYYTSNSVTTETPPTGQTVYVPGATSLELM